MQQQHPGILMQTLDCALLQEKQIRLQVLRLDGLHTVISGNKIFKLHYFLENITGNTIVTFGGAYSNHLVATAFACQQKNITCIGIVRGEEPKKLSHTLLHCLEYGMEVQFISREEYDSKETNAFADNLKKKYPGCIIIPEGGYSTTGAQGAAAIMNYIDESFTHTCCAVGTATTVAGLLLNIQPHQKIIAFPVLKGLNDIDKRIHFLTADKINQQQLHVEDNYHFGGYAKKTPELISFMNEIYNNHKLPTDFVYTAKMMYGVMDLIKKDFFLPGSKICVVHTGGLQGNLSLPKNTLTF